MAPRMSVASDAHHFVLRAEEVVERGGADACSCRPACASRARPSRPYATSCAGGVEHAAAVTGPHLRAGADGATSRRGARAAVRGAGPSSENGTLFQLQQGVLVRGDQAIATPSTMPTDARHRGRRHPRRPARRRGDAPRDARPASRRCGRRGFGQPALLLLSHELVNAAFRDEETFPSAEFYGNTVTDVLGRNLQCMYGEEHRINRALVSPAFRQRLMPTLVPPLLEPIAHELIDRFVGDGRGRPRRRLHEPLPVHRHHAPARPAAALRGRHQALGARHARHPEPLRRRRAVLTRVHGRSCSRSSSSAGVDPGDDLISTLATTEVEGQRLTDEEIFNFLRLLFPAGADTTYLGLGSTLHALLTQPRPAGYRARGPARSGAAGPARKASASTRRPRGSPASTRATSCGTTSRSRPARRCSSA